ncbi:MULTISPECIES: hypothetical protein [unclassified Streptomyces]|uniref:trypsin-like serine peptidase n=2 Tax=unclassified Streptomyces TaxID=2593676 RepID=UPI00039A4EB5|nr:MULTISPECIES: hypothetical protein [unclassified Streptomyces]
MPSKSPTPSMPSAPTASRRRRMRRSAATAVATAALLAFTATACGPSDSKTSAASGGSSATGGSHLPGSLPTSLDALKKWKDGGWQNWDKWARKAQDFTNPIIKGHWGQKRLAQAKAAPDVGLRDAALGSGNGVSNPMPRPVNAREVAQPYHRNMAPVGKIFFDSPQGAMVCSGTIVEDPAHPGKSNLVWTAGHCVHSGKRGGWMRNTIFVPSYNDNGVPMSRVGRTSSRQITPYGKFWADWVITSNEWINQGEESDAGWPYDFAVLHVKPEDGGGKSLQETVGAAAQVWFNAPTGQGFSSLQAFGYPSAAPYDGARMMGCLDRPVSYTVAQGTPAMDRIGCTMTPGSSGGGWFVNRGGKLTLVSNTSIGPKGGSGWLAGPHLGPEAQQVFETMSRKFANQ